MEFKPTGITKAEYLDIMERVFDAYGEASLEKFLELGAYIGVTGMVTFPKSSNIRENLQHIPLDRLLVETDSPYLAPVPFRGKPNHPALVAQVVKYSAEFLGMEPEFLAEKTTANAMKFFDLKEL